MPPHEAEAWITGHTPEKLSTGEGLNQVECNKDQLPLVHRAMNTLE